MLKAAAAKGFNQALRIFVRFVIADIEKIGSIGSLPAIAFGAKDGADTISGHDDFFRRDFSPIDDSGFREFGDREDRFGILKRGANDELIEGALGRARLFRNLEMDEIVDRKVKTAWLSPRGIETGGKKEISDRLRSARFSLRGSRGWSGLPVSGRSWCGIREATSRAKRPMPWGPSQRWSMIRAMESSRSQGHHESAGQKRRIRHR